MTKKDQELLQLTKQFIDNFQPDKINGSLIELYFSFTSITQDFPVQFQAISANIHGLIKFMSQLKKVNEAQVTGQQKRGPKKANKN